MALTKYVSAEWVEATFEGGSRSIKAIGDDGMEYWLPGDSTTVTGPDGQEVVRTVADYDVPPWPEFVASQEGVAFLKGGEAKGKAKK